MVEESSSTTARVISGTPSMQMTSGCVYHTVTRVFNDVVHSEGGLAVTI